MLWTILLSIVVAADSALTIHNGVELNPIFLWIMEARGLNLPQMMFLRLLYYVPIILFLHKYNRNKEALILYILFYTAFSVVGVVSKAGM